METLREYGWINMGSMTNNTTICFSILTLVLLIANNVCPAQSLSNQDKNERAILFKGTVTDVDVEIVDGESWAVVKISLELEFVNNTKTPLLFLHKKCPSCVEAILTKTSGPVEQDNILYDQYRGIPESRSPEWRELHDDLNKMTPPENLIKIVKPGESWITEILFYLRPSLEMKTYSVDRPAVSLNHLRKHSPVWLRLVCDLWNHNVEKGLPSSEYPFGYELLQRWR